MKRILVIAALLIPFAAWGQGVAVRASAGADYKIAKGLHLSFEEEFRAEQGLGSIDSWRHTLEVSFKPVRFLKAEAGYTLINPWEKSPKHRAFASLTGYCKLGDFQFSLKEKFQLTHNSSSELNTFQKPRNAMHLKSRIGLKYKGFRWVEPSLSFEMRTLLNGAWGTTSGSVQTTNNSGKTYYDYTPAGYTHLYNNRYRINAGADINFGKHHSLTPYILIDSCSDYEIDTNSAGTRLFTATTGWVDSTCVSLCLSYTYSF